MAFFCYICEEESTQICARCTKDACDNHLCERCGCCSDCCECEVRLDQHAPVTHAPETVADTAEPIAAAEPEPLPTEPIPDSELAEPGGEPQPPTGDGV